MRQDRITRELEALKLRQQHVEHVLTLFSNTQAELTQKNGRRFFFAWCRSVAGVVVAGAAYAFNWQWIAGAALLYSVYSYGRTCALGGLAESNAASYNVLRLIGEAPKKPDPAEKRGSGPLIRDLSN